MKYVKPAFLFSVLFLAVSCTSNHASENFLIKPPADTEYGHHIPPDMPVPAILMGDTWLVHFKNDLLPYWTMDGAKGVPQGNFPTFRQMDGQPIPSKGDRYPRMLGRQVFLYSLGFLMTGDASLLQLAKDGLDWLIEKAYDKKYGGWYARLDAKGNPIPGLPKTAQDLAYAAQGPSAYFFVTRDPLAEKAVLESFGLIFDPAKYWDGENQRVKDALDDKMISEIDLGNDGGWELTAQLDQVNAFMLLAQPVLTDPADRKKFLDGIGTICGTIVREFWSGGVFWGMHKNKGVFNSAHTDFGHTLKTYWMILQADKRLDGHPFKGFLFDNMFYWISLAFQESKGMWADKMTDYDKASQGGRSWWIYAECDQLAAAANLIDYRYIPLLGKTLTNWMKFVDKDYPCGEVYSGINYFGVKKADIPVESDMKCNAWKNGFHSSEHALVMYILGKNLEKKPVDLYFAVPPGQAGTFIAKPYIFEGTEHSRTNLGNIVIDGTTLSKVKVSFGEIY
ncbi:MAG: hypothetical protein A2Y33_07090 [Spirochaetes bacterium GWF1_51_8]|nr:MAG: hypothetical protein A2Y33_07090 [Spirochaetes bacterium GWF1_51_8]